MEPYARKLVVEWYDKAVGPTIFEKFICLWISFNAWGTQESKKETDAQMVEWAKKNNELINRFQEESKKKEYKRKLNELQQWGPIPRHRKKHGSKDVSINDVSKWNEVLEEVYVIRCNLFHGRKSLSNIPDRSLVRLAYQLLRGVFQHVATALRHQI